MDGPPFAVQPVIMAKLLVANV
ncbi:hypothetical protein CCACVL1_18032 [Corchorus capsularis]|uniref:Uncharacterized protein n=1 Tax=Corchorus capsularis TaxID=210143 RepID=A0A1R3HNF2_COCAP|nr:hypothetical protein CCACVL1_18032 [Corchorus capsularis]